MNEKSLLIYHKLCFKWSSLRSHFSLVSGDRSEMKEASEQWNAQLHCLSGEGFLCRKRTSSQHEPERINRAFLLLQEGAEEKKLEQKMFKWKFQQLKRRWRERETAKLLIQICYTRKKCFEEAKWRYEDRSSEWKYLCWLQPSSPFFLYSSPKNTLTRWAAAQWTRQQKQQQRQLKNWDFCLSRSAKNCFGATA